jgi:hypothetical protein
VSGLTERERDWLRTAMDLDCDLNANDDHLFAAVERIVAERERATQVRALREAIEEHAETYGIACSTSRDWLRARADRLEEGRS